VLKVVDLEPFNDTWRRQEVWELQAPKKPDRKCMIQLDEHQKYLINMTFNVQPQILIPLDNMQPKILIIPASC
jgi:hypothetical protein